MAKDKFTKPIVGTAKTLNFTDTSNSLPDLGVVFNANMRKIIFDVDGDPQDPMLVARYWEDTTAPTNTEGFPLQSGERVELTLEQANGFRVKSLSGTVAVNLTQYEEEV